MSIPYEKLFVKVPLWVLDLGLTPKQLQFYCCVAAFRIVKRGHPHEGEGFPTRAELEKASGLSKSRVNELLCQLKKAGALSSVKEESRVRIDFMHETERAEISAGRPESSAGEAGISAGEAGISAATPTSTIDARDDRRGGKTVADAPAPARQKPRSKKQPPPSYDEIMERAESEGWLRTWRERFLALDGRSGRPRLEAVIDRAMDWQHEKRGNWKSERGQRRFLEQWLERECSRHHGAWSYDQRRQGPVPTEYDAGHERVGVDFGALD